jgi:hypothetical protein
MIAGLQGQFHGPADPHTKPGFFGYSDFHKFLKFNG